MKKITKIALAMAVMAMVSWSCSKPKPEPVVDETENYYEFDGTKTDLKFVYAKHISGEGFDGYNVYFTTETWVNSHYSPEKVVRIYVPTERMGTDIALVEEETKDYWEFLFIDTEAEIEYAGYGDYVMDVTGGTYNGTIDGNNVTLTGDVTFTDGKTFKISYEGTLSDYPPVILPELPAFDETLSNQWKYEGQLTAITESYYIDDADNDGGNFVVSDDVVTEDAWFDSTGNVFAFWAPYVEWGRNIDITLNDWWELYFYLEDTGLFAGGNVMFPDGIKNMSINVDYEGATMTIKANVLFDDDTNLQVKYSGTAKTEWDEDSLLFTDIPKGTIAYSGTPLPTGENPGATTWDTTIVPVEDSGAYYYNIGVWAPQGGSTNQIKVFVDYNDNGTLSIDNTYYVATAGNPATHRGYFEAFYVDGSSIYFLESYSPTYDKSTNTLDFTGTYEGFDVYLGVIAYAVSNGTFAGFFTEGYSNAKGVITPEATGAPAFAPGIKMNYDFATGLYQLPSNIKYGGKVAFDPAKFVKTPNKAKATTTPVRKFSGNKSFTGAIHREKGARR